MNYRYFPKQQVQFHMRIQQCNEDGTCSFDLTSGSDEDEEKFDNNSGEEGYFGSTLSKWIGNIFTLVDWNMDSIDCLSMLLPWSWMWLVNRICNGGTLGPF